MHNVEHARQAWEHVTANNQVLRMYFRLGQGREPFLFFAPHVAIDAIRSIFLDDEAGLPSFLSKDRAEGFNLTNTPNFGQPGNSVTASSFGVIQSTRSQRGDYGSSRQIEFALKLIF